MSIPTVAQVKTRFRALLADPNGVRFTDALFTEGFTEAYDALFNTFMNQQIPRVKNIASGLLLNATVTSSTPAVLGISDFGEMELMEERLFGSSEKFTKVWAREELDQRDQGPILGEFVWRMDTFYFIGATTVRELRITYESSGAAPSTGSIGVEGCLTFLAKAAAQAVAPTKGLDEIAAKYKMEAFGPRWDEGIAGGELLRLCKGRIRTLQHVQLAPKPFSVTRRVGLRRAPYVAAQSGVTGGASVPVQFSRYAGSITGTCDGVNNTFYLAYPVSMVTVTLNGITLTSVQHYVHTANQLVFSASYIPQPNADIMVEAWL